MIGVTQKKSIPEIIDYIANQMKHHNRDGEHIRIMIEMFNNIH